MNRKKRQVVVENRLLYIKCDKKILKNKSNMDTDYFISAQEAVGPSIVRGFQVHICTCVLYSMSQSVRAVCIYYDTYVCF
jgi:hypothetical protein